MLRNCSFEKLGAIVLARLGMTAIAIVATGVASAADWRKTTWGMPSSVVLKTVQKANIANDADRAKYSLPGLGRPELVSTYSAGELQFVAYYHFKNDALTGVTLVGRPEDAGEIFVALRSKYGRATREINSDKTCSTMLVEWMGLGGPHDVRATSTSCAASKQDSIVVTYMKPVLNPDL